MLVLRFRERPENHSKNHSPTLISRDVRVVHARDLSG